MPIERARNQLLGWPMAILAGIGIGFSFRAPLLAPLCIPAVTTLIVIAVRTPDPSAAYLKVLTGWVVGFAIAFPWIVRHPEPGVAVASCTVGVLMASLYAIGPVMGARWIRSWGLLPGLAVAAGIHLAVEWAVTAGPIAFPFGKLGQAFAAYGPASALIAAGSDGAASGAALIAAMSLAAILFQRRTGSRRSMLVAAAVLIAAVGSLHATALGVGTVATTAAGSPAPTADGTGAPTADGTSAAEADSTRATAAGDSVFRILLLQPGTEAIDWAYGDPGDRQDTLIAQTAEALGKPHGQGPGEIAASDQPLGEGSAGTGDANRTPRATGQPGPELIVWPESALSLSEPIVASLGELQATVNQWGVSLASGARIGRQDGSFSNSILVLQPFAPPTRYDKRRPIPLIESAAFAGVRLGSGPDIVPGSSVTVVDIGGRRIGLAICFETLFPGHARELAQNGAQAIIAVTQDGWWSSALPALQHFRFSRSRALETGLPLIQASVSGISGVWLPGSGTALPPGGIAKERSISLDVPLPARGRPHPVDAGGWLALSLLGAAVLGRVSAGPRPRTA